MQKSYNVSCQYCHNWFVVINAWNEIHKEIQCPQCTKVGVLEYTNEDDNENIVDFELIKTENIK